jgi:hypothetical protein
VRFALFSFLLASTAWGAERVPVIVELFTSEGCSSCPPADSLLADLIRTQPIKSAEIIALEQHVDYWNRLGWKDPFSSAQFTARQDEYARRFRIDSIYTPQMVVDGRTQFVGNDPRRASAEIANAAAQPKAMVRLSIEGGALRIEANAASESDLVLAITETALETDVKRGENGGRTLVHSAVVRSWSSTKIKGTANQTVPLRIDPAWTKDHVSAVAFVQDRRTGVITAAVRIPLH